jgi:Sec-independent protein secretion pathway component TatC
VKLAIGIGRHNPRVVGAAVLTAYGLVYFGAAYAFGIEECVGALRRLARRLR